MLILCNAFCFFKLFPTVCIGLCSLRHMSEVDSCPELSGIEYEHVDNYNLRKNTYIICEFSSHWTKPSVTKTTRQTCSLAG